MIINDRFNYLKYNILWSQCIKDLKYKADQVSQSYFKFENAFERKKDKIYSKLG